jgi:hypothetical protein
MKNSLLKEVRRVTGWHALIDHEAFPLLLAALSSTSIFWFFPGVDRIHAAYFPQMHQAAVIRAIEPVIIPVTSPVEVIDENGETIQDGNVMDVEVMGEL